jgi:hypothetical protein
MKASALLLSIFLYCCHSYGQPINCTVESYDKKSSNAFIDEKKIVPKELEEAILHTLNFFPELSESKIRFKWQRIKTTMNARPTLGSVIFRKPLNYRYVVRINSREIDSVIQVKNIPFDALIGVFGHEFCHFIDYRTHKMSHLVKRAFDYGSKKRKETFEKEIDRMAISRGLGCHLYKWSTYVLFDSNAKASYKAFKRSTYLQPHEILELMPQ